MSAVGVSLLPAAPKVARSRSLSLRRGACFVIFAFVSAFLLATGAAHAQTPAPQFLYSANGPSHTIWGYQLDPATGALTPVPGSPFDSRLNPVALAVNPAGTFLFAANDANNVSVFTINAATGALAEIPNSPFATGLGLTPAFIATDPTGKFLYVANQQSVSDPTGNAEIDAYSINPATGVLTPTPNSTPPSLGTWIAPNLTGMYVHPNGRWIYFESSIDDFTSGQIQLFVIDPATGDLSGYTSPFGGLGNADGLTGDWAGHFLVAQFGTCVNLESVAISPLDGSLSVEGSWTIIGAPGFVGCTGGHSMAVDSTGSFMVLSVGTFSVPSLEPAQVVPDQSIDYGPWLADPLGPFFFASGITYRIDTTTGTLTQVAGSSFQPGIMAITGFPPQSPAPGAQFSPGSLQFTNSEVGVPGAPQMMDLVNTGTATLDITGISVTGANNADFMQSNTCGATLAAGAKCTFTVTFTPSTTSPESASITVTDSAAGSPHSAPLTSTGVVQTPPAPSLNPLSLNFPSTSVGSTASMSFSIVNSGDQSLAVSAVTIGGSNPGDFAQTNSCSSVSGNSSCSVSVTFQPQAAGQRTATVNVNFGSLGSQQVALTGLGATFAIAPSGPTSATVQPGQPATYSASFTPAPGYAGTATFTCAVAPAGPACVVSPSMLQIAASNSPPATPVSVTVNTPASASTRLHTGFLAAGGASPSTGDRLLRTHWPIELFALALLSLFAFARLPIGGAVSRRFAWSGLATILAMAALFAIASCGGGGGGSTQPQPQHYTVTLTTAAGATMQTVNYSLTVQ